MSAVLAFFSDPPLQKVAELNAPLAETLRWNQVWQYFGQSGARNIFHKKKTIGSESMGVVSCSALLQSKYKSTIMSQRLSLGI